MIRSLFKSVWKSVSVDKRLHFIADIDVSVTANQLILENLAANDVDTSVRHAAMLKISNPQTLYDLCQSQDNTDNKNNKESGEVAETAFRHLIQSDEMTEAEFKTFLANNPKSNLLIAKYCPHADIRKEILVNLNESEQANIIADIAYSVTRVMLAENIHSSDSLEVARKKLKGRDKNAEKIIKAKIDLLHAEQKLMLENTALVKSICEKMEALARYVAWSDEIKVKFFSLTKRWDTLDFDPSEVEKTRYREAFTKVEKDVKHNMAMAVEMWLPPSFHQVL